MAEKQQADPAYTKVTIKSKAGAVLKTFMANDPQGPEFINAFAADGVTVDYEEVNEEERQVQDLVGAMFRSPRR